MHAEADLERDDDAPPPSGVRARSLAIAILPGRAPRRDVLAEVAEEVFFEVWSVVRGLSPLQGAWLCIGPAQILTAALEMSTWRLPEEPPVKTLCARWPELVPGSASLDRLAHLLVDALCA